MRKVITDQRYVQKNKSKLQSISKGVNKLRKLCKTQKNSIIRIRKIRNKVTDIRENLIYKKKFHKKKSKQEVTQK